MTAPFFKRLADYYWDVAKVLRWEAEASSIFPNSSDVGNSRELVYARFLKAHTPSKCNVFLGWFLFGEEGDESKQLDVIITTDTTPRFNFQNHDGRGKSFSPVEWCLWVACIKSNLDRDQLFDALTNIASIPPTQPLWKRINPMLKFKGYENWPYKIIYASSGLKWHTILEHINNFYESNSSIPVERRPDIIHVVWQYVIFKIQPGMSVTNTDWSVYEIENGKYHIFDAKPDIQAIIWTLEELQKKATASNHILFNYSEIINKINNK